MTEYKVTETGKILVSDVEPVVEAMVINNEVVFTEKSTPTQPLPAINQQEAILENKKRVLEELLLTQVGILKKYLFLKGHNIYVDGYSILDSNHITVWTLDKGVVMDLTHQLTLEPSDRLFISSISKAVQCIIKEQFLADKAIIELKVNSNL